MSRDPALKAYFEEATRWDMDRATSSQRSARLAWGVAGVAAVCALLSASALLVLLPLKRIEPFLIRVDARTGIVDSVPVYTGAAAHAGTALHAGTATPSETVTRYLLTHYVSTCQRFLGPALAESDYQECGAFHTPKQNAAWAALWNRANPRSPLNVYADGTRVRVQVTAVTFLKSGAGESIAQVRYFTAQRRGDAGAETLTHWLATVEYTYVAPSSDPQRRQVNPLGFRIVAFSTQVEALGETPEPASNAAAAGAAP